MIFLEIGGLFMGFWKVSSDIQEKAYLIGNKSFPTAYSVWRFLTSTSGQGYAAEILETYKI